MVNTSSDVTVNLEHSEEPSSGKMYCPMAINALLKMGSYSSIMMCQYWDNHLIY